MWYRTSSKVDEGRDRVEIFAFQSKKSRVWVWLGLGIDKRRRLSVDGYIQTPSA